MLSSVGGGEPYLDGFGELLAREFWFFDFPSLLPLPRATERANVPGIGPDDAPLGSMAASATAAACNGARVAERANVPSEGSDDAPSRKHGCFRYRCRVQRSARSGTCQRSGGTLLNAPPRFYPPTTPSATLTKTTRASARHDRAASGGLSHPSNARPSEFPERRRSSRRDPRDAVDHSRDDHRTCRSSRGRRLR